MRMFEIDKGVKMSQVVKYEQIFNACKTNHFQKVGTMASLVPLQSTWKTAARDPEYLDTDHRATPAAEEGERDRV